MLADDQSFLCLRHLSHWTGELVGELSVGEGDRMMCN